MNMSKKFLAVIIAGCSILMLSACGSGTVLNGTGFYDTRTVCISGREYDAIFYEGVDIEPTGESC